MEIPGLNKVGDAIGNAFSVFDFSFFISGSLTLAFIVLDMHYYGHDGILSLDGWKSIVGWILAIYICGLMSWSTGKCIRWFILRLFWYKSGGIRGDFKDVFERTTSRFNQKEVSKVTNIVTTDDNDVAYTKMWLSISMDEKLKEKTTYLNKMWVMVAVYEGLLFSWIVGLFVYLDGLFVGKWISLDLYWLCVVPILVLLVLFASSCWRATAYSRDLVKEVVVTYYESINK